MEPARDPVRDALDEHRRRLLDLTRRNRLLSFRATRRTTIRVVDEAPSELFRLLVQEDRALGFLPGEPAPPRVDARPTVEGVFPRAGAAAGSKAAFVGKELAPWTTTLAKEKAATEVGDGLEAAPASPAPRDAVALGVHVEGAPGRCPFCHDAIGGGEPAAVCEACLSRHHAECWEEAGRCASCAGATALVSARFGRGDLAASAPSPLAAVGDDGLTYRRVDRQALPERHRDLKLQTDLPPSELERNLVALQRSASSTFEEQGFNSLYLALGFLEWRERGSDVTLKAPLLLVPVELERRTLRSSFQLRAGDDDPLLNPALLYRLETEWGLKLESLLGEPGQEGGDADALDPDAVLSAIAAQVAELPGWRVTNEAALALFSFTKLVMYKDLERFEREVLANPVLRRLLGDDAQALVHADLGGAPRPDAAPTLVLDADGSQEQAVRAALQGESLVLEGPPGTGKSQTIANLIAAFLAAGKSVLFVSEKMAALEVVRRRLEHVGLGPACLELHSRKASKREVVQELARTLERELPPDHAEDDVLAHLTTVEARLAAHTRALHEPFGALSSSPYQALGALAADEPPTRTLERAARPLKPSARSALVAALPPVQGWTQADLLERERALRGLGEQLAAEGAPEEHPCRGVRRADLPHTARAELAEALVGLRAALDEVRAAGRALSGLLRLNAPDALTELAPALELAALLGPGRPEVGPLVNPDWRVAAPAAAQEVLELAERRAEIGRRLGAGYAATLLEVEGLLEAAAGIERYGSSWYRVFVPAYWRARGAFTPHLRGREGTPEAVARDLRLAARLKDLNRRLSARADDARALFGSVWERAGGEPSGDDPSRGDPTGDDPSRGDPTADDPTAGDPSRGDPTGDDPSRGDPTADDPGRGDPTGGEFPGQGYDRAALDAVGRRAHTLQARLAASRLPQVAPGALAAALRAGELPPERLLTARERALAAQAALEEAWARFVAVGAFDLREGLAASATSERAAPSDAANELAHAPWGALGARLEELEQALPRLSRWARLQSARDEAAGAGLAPFVAVARARGIAPEQLAATLRWAALLRWLDEVQAERPAMRRFDRPRHEADLAEFALLDQRRLRLARVRLAHRLASARPDADWAAADGSELGLLQRELRRKRGHLPVRQLLRRMPRVIARLKPCLLMSPLSVAQFTEPGLHTVDLVVFDEASQIAPEDALGAIARGRQVVVVGDSQQMPPTSFFQAAVATEAADRAELEGLADLESVLDACVARGLPRRTLRWHYRSRHEGLIAFSNRHFYEGRLRTFPAPGALRRARDAGSARLGVELRHVADGRYERGGSGRNEPEAEAVAEAALRHLLSGDGRSLGIGAFSQAQQEAILDALERRLRAHPDAERLLQGEGDEPLFVKNLENLQGDERDVIFVSIGYGPDAQGRLPLNFGPLNPSGGERRLNVLVTRAREQVVVFASFLPDQLDASRSKSRGVQLLAEYLALAARGGDLIALDEPAAPPGLERRQLLETIQVELGRALAGDGLEVVRDVGTSGTRVDLAVRPRAAPAAPPASPGANAGQQPDAPGGPGVVDVPDVVGAPDAPSGPEVATPPQVPPAPGYVLGLLLDGARSAALPTVRDRERILPAVLTQLGWRIERVWALEWHRDPQGACRRLTALARDAARRALEVAEADEARAADERARGAEVDATIRLAAAAQEVASPLVRYRELSVTRRGPAAGFPDVPASELTALVAEVVAAEGPIHPDELARRVLAHWELTRSGKRSRSRVEEATAAALAEGAVVARGAFLWPLALSALPDAPHAAGGAELPIRDRSQSGPRDPRLIPPEELAAALRLVARKELRLGRDDLVQRAARLLGFTRAGERSRKAFDAGVDALIAQGELHEDAGIVTAEPGA